MKYIFLSLLLMVVACSEKPTTEQIETLQLAKQNAFKRNIKLLSQINQTVMDLGKRPEHMQLLDQAQNVLNVRGRHGLVSDKEDHQYTYNAENVDAYLNDINIMVSAIQERNKEQPTLLKNQLAAYRTRIEKLLEQDDALTPHYLSLNLLYLEWEVLNKLALELGHN